MNRTMGQDGSPSTITIVEERSTERTNSVQQLILTPQQAEEPRVHWSADTIDNEMMGRHKSKCCCIYKKPKKWDDDSADDTDSECETSHCRGHVEKRFHPSSGGGDGKQHPSCHA